MVDEVHEKKKDEAQNMKENILALNRESMAVQFDLKGSDFEAGENIGSGAYGVVCSAVDKRSGARVAIKKISDIFAQPTIAMRTYREIKILRHFKHENIIGIKNILCSKENDKIKDVYIVFSLMETDLHRIIYSSQPLSLEHVRYFLYQVVRGLKFIHSANILHRDLKPSNLLVNENCDLKIGDFGMARGIVSTSSSSDDESERQLTHYVATRWYRAPELLLQSPIYSTGVDLWSVGCILAELISRKTLFPGRNMLHQLELIFNFVGVPSDNCMDLSFSDKIKRFIKYKCELNKIRQEDISSKFPGACKEALSLLSGLLQLDSGRRCSAEEILRHPFLRTYHDPDDEPACPRVFDFSFEHDFKKFSGPQNADKLCKVLEDSIQKEIDRYRLLRDFPSTLMKMPTPLPESCKRMVTSLEATDPQYGPDEIYDDQLIRPPSANKESNPTSDQNSERDPCEDSINEVAINLNTDFTPSKPLNISTTTAMGDNPTDVDMLSAKMGSASLRDSEMPSPAQPEPLYGPEPRGPLDDKDNAGCENQREESKAQEDVGLVSEVAFEKFSSDPVQPESQGLDAKAKIKAALLFNSEQKKERMRLVIENSRSVKHTVTALQRQKEREEKRRLKQERALKRRERHKDGSLRHSEGLSSDDKKLLERWNNMQKHLHMGNSVDSIGPEMGSLRQSSSNQVFTIPLLSYLKGLNQFSLMTPEAQSDPLESMRPPFPSGPLPVNYFPESQQQQPNIMTSPFPNAIPPTPSFPAREQHQQQQQTFPASIVLGNDPAPMVPLKQVKVCSNQPPQGNLHRLHQINQLGLIAKRCQFSSSNSNWQPTANLPTIATILPSGRNVLPSGLRISKELAKLSDAKESQESAPLSATLLADWTEMTKEIDAGDLEAAILDYEHGPPKINSYDMNFLLPHP